MDDEHKCFAKYLVIFVDILGSQGRTDFSEIYHINEIFHREFENNQKNDLNHTVYFRIIYTFSDGAYIFYGFKEDKEDERKKLGELFKVALCNCEPIFLRFLKERIVFRGGISYGDAYIDLNRSMFFGGAINRACQLESKTALHPRIVVEPEVAEIFQAKYKMLAQNPEYVYLVGRHLMVSMPEVGEGIIERDEDGQFIFNYLHFPENNMICYDINLSGRIYLEELLNFCYEQIDINTDYKIIDKYYYLLRYVNNKLRNLE